MKQINLPPFYVGQKVVAIADVHTVKKGQCVIVKDQKQCKKCRAWFLEFGELEPSMPVKCTFCNTYLVRSKTKVAWYDSRDFAPITENFQSISLEKVLEEETKLIGVN